MLPFGKCAVLSLDMGPVFCRCSGKGPFLLTAEMGGGEGERTEKDQESLALKPLSRSALQIKRPDILPGFGYSHS